MLIVNSPPMTNQPKTHIVTSYKLSLSVRHIDLTVIKKRKVDCTHLNYSVFW